MQNLRHCTEPVQEVKNDVHAAHRPCAASYGGKFLFECIRCGYETVTNGGMLKHVVMHRGTTKTSIFYRNYTSKFVDELKTMLGKWFSDSAEGALRDSKQPDPPVLRNSDK